MGIPHPEVRSYRAGMVPRGIEPPFDIDMSRTITSGTSNSRGDDNRFCTNPKKFATPPPGYLNLLIGGQGSTLLKSPKGLLNVQQECGMDDGLQVPKR